MTDTAAATAAPIEYRIGGKTLRLAPLTDADHGELDNWVRSRLIRIAREAIPYDATASDREELLQAALMRASTLTWMGEHGYALARTTEGMARLVWQCLQRHHARDRTITVEWIRGELSKDANATTEFVLAFGRLNDTLEVQTEKKTEDATAGQGTA